MSPDRPAPRRIVLAGASGTIGSAVAAQLAAEAHAVTPVPRAALADGAALAKVMDEARPEVVISCIASRSGAPKDAEAVDYRANLALLEAAEAADVAHFILLSAICVQKPLLAFQHAKLKFEARLTASGLSHTIIRPTAFFKSLSGQVKRVKAGKPFLIFGDGNLTRCKPISDGDLADFIAGCQHRLPHRQPIHKGAIPRFQVPQIPSAKGILPNRRMAARHPRIQQRHTACAIPPQHHFLRPKPHRYPLPLRRPPLLPSLSQ